jgi:hypothetical protein
MLRARWAQDEDAAAVVRRQVAGARDVLPVTGEVRPADVRVHPAIHEVGCLRRDAESGSGRPRR